jgi:hypothetical protein
MFSIGCEEETMRLRAGEVYVCTEPNCKAEIVVRKSADNACQGKFELRCCCGKEMAREDRLMPVAGAAKEKKRATA